MPFLVAICLHCSLAVHSPSTAIRVNSEVPLLIYFSAAGAPTAERQLLALLLFSVLAVQDHSFLSITSGHGELQGGKQSAKSSSVA